MKNIIPIITMIILCSCGTTRNQPVVVQISDPPVQGTRFRNAERQRDVWIAPHANDNGMLIHDEVMTYVEQPSSWSIPNTLEPNASDNPKLPMENGDYDSQVIKRQKEMILAHELELKKMAQEIEKLRQANADEISSKETQIQNLNQTLTSEHKKLGDANKQLQDIADQEKRKQDEQSKKSFWQFWK